MKSCGGHDDDYKSLSRSHWLLKRERERKVAAE